MSPQRVETTSQIPAGHERSVKNKSMRVDLVGATQLLLQHLTPALCQAVFKRVRKTERERKWTFHAVAQFWTALIIQHPSAISHGLDETRKGRGRNKVWPRVIASSQAFFEKCQALRPGLFRELFEAFTTSLLPQIKPSYASWLKKVQKNFPSVYIVDGSRLDAICNRLAILRTTQAEVIPGCLMAYYDLFRGIVGRLFFFADAAASELHNAINTLSWMAQGSLVVADRLYCNIQFFHHLSQHQLFGVFRLFKSLKIQRLGILYQHQSNRLFVEDVLVLVGSGQSGFPKQRLRLIRYRNGKIRRDILTNVLDPSKLTWDQIVGLYGLRWTIERMFFDLKEVLDLHCLYASHPNLVAQQVYAAAMVYTAFRAAQAHIAQRAKILPEQISAIKLFPRLAQAVNDYCMSQWYAIETRALNPGIHVIAPDFHRYPTSYTWLRSILAQRRSRLRKPPKKGAQWKSFVHIKGGRALLQNASVD